MRRFQYEIGRALRETGQAIGVFHAYTLSAVSMLPFAASHTAPHASTDRIGLQSLEKPVFKEPCACVSRAGAVCLCVCWGALEGFGKSHTVGWVLAVSRHRPVMNLFDKHPWTSPDVFVAPSASVIGAVDINLKSSVMYGAVVRGDLSPVDIGAYTSIGDRAVVHTAETVEGSPEAKVVIGDYVQVGPSAVLQSCTVQSGAKIGAGAIVMEGALVEADAEVGAGAVVHSGRRVPSGELWEGNPATKTRDLTKTEIAAHQAGPCSAVARASCPVCRV